MTLSWKQRCYAMKTAPSAKLPYLCYFGALGVQRCFLHSTAAGVDATLYEREGC